MEGEMERHQGVERPPANWVANLKELSGAQLDEVDKDD